MTPRSNFERRRRGLDRIVALREKAREVWALGSETLQIFAPDELETFAPAVTLDLGCAAQHGVIPYEEDFVWLDNLRRFVISNGRSLTKENILSSPYITATLEQFATVNDCWSFRQRIGSHDLLYWVFPTEGRAFAYDMLSKRWAECRGWEDGTWAPWKAQSYHYWSARNLHLVGLDDGSIGRLTFDAHDDMGDTIKWVARSGFNDHGTPRPKRSKGQHSDFVAARPRRRSCRLFPLAG